MPHNATHPINHDADTTPDLCLSASLDLIHAEGLLSELQERLGRDADIHMEGTAVVRVSTACLQVLAAAALAARKRGGGFGITGASPALCSAAQDLGLDVVLGIGVANDTVCREIG